MIEELLKVDASVDTSAEFYTKRFRISSEGSRNIKFHVVADDLVGTPAVTLQESGDGDNWSDVSTFDLSSDGVNSLSISDQVDADKALLPLKPIGRIKIVASGGSTIEAVLVDSADFDLGSGSKATIISRIGLPEIILNFSTIEGATNFYDTYALLDTGTALSFVVGGKTYSWQKTGTANDQIGAGDVGVFWMSESDAEAYEDDIRIANASVVQGTAAEFATENPNGVIVGGTPESVTIKSIKVLQ